MRNTSSAQISSQNNNFPRLWHDVNSEVVSVDESSRCIDIARADGSECMKTTEASSGLYRKSVNSTQDESIFGQRVSVESGTGTIVYQAARTG